MCCLRMVKRVVVFGIFILLLAGLFFVQGEPGTPGDIDSGDVEAVQDVISNIPIGDDGKFDPTKFEPIKSKAEERIDKINAWLSENAVWLKVVFGMVPELSWLFAINLFIWLFALMIFALNGHIWAEVIGTLPDFFTDEIDLVLFETTWANFVGLGVFIVFLILEVYYKFALSAINFMGTITGNNEWGYWWNFGFRALIVVLLFVLLPFVSKGINAIDAWNKKKREDEDKKDESQNRDELAAVIGGISEENP